MSHCSENNETYFNHLLFATRIGSILVIRGVIFILHGLFPICSVPKRFNLEDTYDKLKKWNDYTENRMR